MTESKVEKVPETAKELLALNPEQESVFKQKVQEAKKNKSKKVSNDGSSEPFHEIYSFKRPEHRHLLC